MTVGAWLAIAVALLGLIGMVVSWRRRGRRQSGIRVPEAPQGSPAVLASASGLYLSTTPVGSPLERIVAGGLGFRARAVVDATADGIVLRRDGAHDLLIARDRLQGIGTATWTIDRGVERDGLTVLRWRLGDGDEAVDVESSLRLGPDDRAALAAALHQPITDQEVPHDGR